MKVTTAAQQLLAAFFVSLLLTNPANAQRFLGPLHKKTVKFQRGKSLAVIEGVARTPGTYEYRVGGVKAGQAMLVSVVSANTGVEISIETPGGGGWAPNGLGVMTWAGRAEASGDYLINLTNNKSELNRNPEYTLTILVDTPARLKEIFAEPLQRSRKATEKLILAARTKNWPVVLSILNGNRTGKNNPTLREIKERAKEFRYFQVRGVGYGMSAEQTDYKDGFTLDSVYVSLKSSRSPGWAPVLVFNSKTYEVVNFYTNDD